MRHNTIVSEKKEKIKPERYTTKINKVWSTQGNFPISCNMPISLCILVGLGKACVRVDSTPHYFFFNISFSYSPKKLALFFGDLVPTKFSTDFRLHRSVRRQIYNTLFIYVCVCVSVYRCSTRFFAFALGAARRHVRMLAKKCEKITQRR